MAAILCAWALPCAGQNAQWQKAVGEAARVAPEAEILVMEIGSGRLIAAQKFREASLTLAAPGSTLKPIALYQLIHQGRWDPTQRIACSRSLHVANHALNCPHPPLPPMDAREALTWSCNTYFATVAASLKPGELRGLLAPSGLLASTWTASDEAVARILPANTTEERQLELLGVDGIRVTPLELIHAYRWLALEFAAHPDSEATRVVWSGLKDSASYGMADAATSGGAAVAGKTGTASGVNTASTHGWFVGLAPVEKPQVVMLVFQPLGHGANAAAIAAELLKHSPLGKP